MSALRSLAVAFSFLTRVPTRIQDVSSVEFGRSVAWFPVVGFAFGLVVVSANALLSIRLAPELRAVILIAIVGALSGGLHLDGLADTFDALGGGRRDRDRMLAIMRDSRIGAHGATALFLLLAAKGIALAQLLSRGAVWVLLVWPVVGRWAVVPLIVFFPYARERGLGTAFHEHTSRLHLLVATTFTVAIVARTIPAEWPAALAATVLALSLGAWMWLRLGGLTGDIYGAAVEVAEMTFLVFVSAGSTSR